ncbi:hypothetical protein [Streptomyces boncukensis]|uniref:Uncharacterized protein n=1 Tax=Streptomyces boncukensis TaxID=2711219 RepID=A0A6G4WSC0_9ACTN|nr:hypothetical protein [Streptomyces boncukensis]NGO68166.1 hypothetical protein [Streptomyces boncukensis]
MPAGGGSSFNAEGVIVLAACCAAGVAGILAAGGLSRPLLRAVARQAGARGEWALREPSDARSMF